MKKIIPVLALLCLILTGCEIGSAPTARPTQPLPTRPQKVTAGYCTGAKVDMGGFFVTEVTAKYEDGAITLTHTVDDQTFQNTYDHQGRLTRQVIDGADGYHSEETRLYSTASDKPFTVTYIRGSFRSQVQRSFDDNGNVLTEKYTASDNSWNTTENTYDENGRLLTEKYKSSGGSDTLLTNTYDEKGNLVSAVTLNKGKKTREVRHTYDGKGRVIQDYVWRLDLGDNTVTASTTDLTYDDNDNILTQYQVDLDGYWNKIESTYTADGKLLTDKHSDSDGNTYAVAHTYDEKGNLATTVEGYNGEDYRYEFEYDADGHQTKRTVIDPAGNTTGTTRWVYDGAGRLLEENYAGASGDTERKVYSYDDAGNLLTCTAYYGDEVSSTYSYTYSYTELTAEQAQQLKTLMQTIFVEFLP